jgi:hypothetical protein
MRTEARFLKFGSCPTYNVNCCINWYEYLKRQFGKGIDFEALDNSVLTCEDAKRLGGLCETYHCGLPVFISIRSPLSQIR